MKRRKLLVVFVDALGPDQLQAFGGALALAPHRRSLQGTFGYSSGAIASLLTGADPEAHGRMCLFARAQGESTLLAPLRWLGLLPRVLHERGQLRRLLARALQHAAGLTGYVALHRVPPAAFGWLDLPEREDVFTAERIGGAETFLSRARGAGLSVYASPWQLPEAQRFAHTREQIMRTQPDLVLLYAAELDAVLHRHGPDGAAARPVRARIANTIADMAERMRRDGSDVSVLVVGDHDMAAVDRVVDPRALVSQAHVRHFVDSTLLRVWGGPTQLARVRLGIERARVPGTWLDRDALSARAAPVVGSPYGDAIFVLDEGVLFSPSFVGGRARGMHGYDLGRRSSYAALAASVPLPDAVRATTDVSGWVLEQLGLAA